MPVYQVQAGAETSAVCMSKMTKAIQTGNRQFTVIVPADAAATLKARGFAENACGEMLADLPEYRKKICAFAAKAPSKVQDEFYNNYSTRPSELCAYAQKIVRL
jgi:hypothetical protein